MNFAWGYTAKNQGSKTISGLIYASDKTLAYAKLKRAGLKASALHFDIFGTINGLSGRFNVRELVRFYRTIGNRMEAGKPILKGMDAAISFTSDPMLVNALSILKQRLVDGSKVADAMQVAGFPERDLNVIRSAELAGKQSQAFIRLAEDVDRAERLSSSIKSAFLPIKILAVVGLIGIYSAMAWLSPTMIKFFSQWSSGKSSLLPGSIRAYNIASLWTADHKILGGVIVVAILFVGISVIKSQFIHNLMDKWPEWRSISEKSDHASAWTSFSLLYNAGGVPAYEAAAVVRKSCTRPDTQDMFNRMDKVLRLGTVIHVAVERAKFPQYIVNGVHSAEEGGSSIATGLLSMVTDLEQDVEVMTSMLKLKVTYLSQIFGGIIVVIFFYFTLYPMYMQIGQKL